jgi:hypothetical protein
MPTPVRQRILGAALNLIQRRGIERVTTREIAMAAGAAEGCTLKGRPCGPSHAMASPLQTRRPLTRVGACGEREQTRNSGWR